MALWCRRCARAEFTRLPMPLQIDHRDFLAIERSPGRRLCPSDACLEAKTMPLTVLRVLLVSYQAASLMICPAFLLIPQPEGNLRGKLLQIQRL